MPDKTYVEFTEDSNPALDDYLLTLDSSADETKRVSIQNIRAPKIIYVSTTQTLSANADFVIATGTITLTLFAPTKYPIAIKNVGSGIVTVSGNIDDGTTAPLGEFESIIFVPDLANSRWLIF